MTKTARCIEVVAFVPLSEALTFQQAHLLIPAIVL